MSGPAFAALLGIAAVLSAAIALEFGARSREEDGMNPPTLAQPAPALRTGATRPAGQAAAWAQTALARPLFSPTRRPAAGPAAAAPGAPASLPRVTAILVSPSGKSVIFAAGDGGKPVVAGEGGRVGAYQVQSIEAGRVTVLGPSGPQVLGPSFDGAPPPRRSGGAPDLSGLLGLPGLPPAAPGATPGAPGADPGLSIPGLSNPGLRR